MYLLNVESMRVEKFEDQIPPYAILSHCWGTGGVEVTFEDINGAVWEEKAGGKKIKFAAQQAASDGIHYVWVDTCCIDKSSSAELSEAINSMFRWYEQAVVCYAFLDDVTGGQIVLNETLKRFIRESKWFTRGWTLQELIAPTNIDFFDSEWNFFGGKKEKDLLDLLSTITTIEKDVLDEPHRRSSKSIAKRMSWAAGRQTTRVEDIAYSLLGIFNVNMPPLYGEGNRAFTRLQEAILKETDDQSLFAWEGSRPLNTVDSKHFQSVLAESPNNFSNTADMVPCSNNSHFFTPYTMTNRGVRMSIKPQSLGEEYPGVVLATLQCHRKSEPSKRCAIAIQSTDHDNTYERHSSFELQEVSHVEVKCWLRRKPWPTIMYIAKNPSTASL